MLATISMAPSGAVFPINCKLRAECLNAHWFISFDDARAKTEDSRRDYNEFRSHSAISNKVPISLMNGSSTPTPT